jgi:hypothetical protein
MFCRQHDVLSWVLWMPIQSINQSINVTPVAMKLKKLMPAIH